LGLNGQIYEDAADDRGMMNYDTGEFLSTDIEKLAQQEGLDGWIDPDEGADGPPIHGACRCFTAPVLTFEQYKGNIQTTISEV